MTIALQQLLAPQTLDSVIGTVLANLQTQGLPTTDWSPFGPEMAFVQMTARSIYDALVLGLPITVGGNFVDYATGDWLTLNSAQRYQNARNPATFTQGTIVLTNATASPITLSSGQLRFLFPSGNRYVGPVGAGPFVLGASSTLAITVQSEGPNHSVAISPTDVQALVNYIDPSNSTIQMVTSLAGVTAANPAPLYSQVAHLGSGTGSVATSGTPSAARNVQIRIDVSGQVGGLLVYSYSIDGGVTFTTGQTSSSQSNIGGFGIGFTLANGATNPSFIRLDYYSFSCPGGWISQQGTDAEYDAALATRDNNKWPSLATQAAIPGSPTLGFYDLLVRQSSPQITQTLVQTDATINNRINIYVAGQGGILPGAIITAAQSYLAVFNMLTDLPVVQSPVPLSIVLGALTITCRSSLIPLAQANLQAALQTFFASLGLNASTAGGVIRHARIIQIIEDTVGVVDISDTAMTINGAATSLVLPTTPGAVQLPTWTQVIATLATWVPA